MTAEIAILNRTALALAADSAATITGPGGSKTYDSAEKIFELCRHQPIGMMIYNNATFMGVPFDVVVRRFREENGELSFERVPDIWSVFHKYILSFPRDVADERDHLKQYAFRIFGHIRRAAGRALMAQITERAFAKRRGTLVAPDQLIIELANHRRTNAEEHPLQGYLPELTFEEFAERYGEAVVEAGQIVFDGNPIEGAVRDALQLLMFALIRSRQPSGSSTGLVFGGFGTKDIFPTLHSVEIDGVYFGQSRVLSERTIDIDRRGETAAIVPFAQKDMPERFIFGLDEQFQARIEQIVEGIVAEIVRQKPRSFRAGQATAIKTAARQHLGKALEELKTSSEQKLMGVLNFMSKRELAEMAYSLVELTSRKRKFSDDQETVGGPIDVAVLSRNEGFIWIRRKHYFDANLNPGYFNRTFKPQGPR